MPQGAAGSDTGLADVERRRSRNFRQLLLRASRAVNRHVVRELVDRGYGGLRATHTTLLSNIDLAGSTVTEAAERAGITKQAMGRLASELQSAGYLEVAPDPRDARTRNLRLTAAGHKLMLESLEVMAALEDRYARLIGEAGFAGMLRGLQAFVERVPQD